MPRSPNAQSLDAKISKIALDAAAAIAAVVREELRGQIARTLGGGHAVKVSLPAASAAPKAAAKSGGKRRVRRNAAQVEADQKALLAFLKSHPNSSAGAINKSLGWSKLKLSAELKNLRGAGAVKMKGMRATATYSAA